MVIYIGVHWIDGGVRQKENEKGGGGTDPNKRKNTQRNLSMII